MYRGLLVLLALLVLTHGTSLVTVGFVTTGSMHPTLPEGSLFLALSQDPATDDIIVFDRANGDTAVHRVIDITPEGLITQGDANQRTDQASGEPPVDPDGALVVPMIATEPAAVTPDWLKPLGVLAAQIALIAYALKRLLGDNHAERGPWPLNALRLHHVILLAAGLLLASAPLLHEEMTSTGTAQVQGTVLPTAALVTSQEGSHQLTIGPLGAEEVPASGQTSIVRAPATPGANALAPYGSTAAMLPTVLSLAAGALLLRKGGW